MRIVDADEHLVEGGEFIVEPAARIRRRSGCRARARASAR